jgi:hypothetical protein
MYSETTFQPRWRNEKVKVKLLLHQFTLLAEVNNAMRLLASIADTEAENQARRTGLRRQLNSFCTNLGVSATS